MINTMTRRFGIRLFRLLTLVCLLSGVGSVLADGNMKILLDPGHSPQPGQQGVMSVRGVSEVSYNDQFAAKLSKALRAASIDVRLTRQPYQTTSLAERANIANDWRRDLFLSLNHDYAQLVNLKRIPRLT